MGKFVKEIRIEKEFDGDSVVAVARPLAIADLVSMKRTKAVESDEDKAADILEMVTVFRKYLVSLTGVKDSNGVGVESEVVMENAYFLPLVADLATEWMSRSMPNAKN